MDNICLGKLIKELRSHEKMRQEDLALKLGVSSSAVSKWETGKNLPDTDILQQLAHIFHVSVDVLYHPEQTLSTLNKTAIEGEIINTQATTFRDKIRIKKVLIILLILSLIVFFSIIGIHKLFSNSDPTDLTIQPILYQITEDELLGTVYEVSCVYSGEIESIDLFHPFIMQFSEDWIKDTSISSEVSIMKISLYNKETDIENQEPIKNIYLSR